MTWGDKDFEELMTKEIDSIYHNLFDGLKNIYRADRESESDKKIAFMDQELAIDTHLFFSDGTALTFQEKTRRPHYRHFQEFTFEYYNNPRTGEQGEWHKLASQLYFFGYAECKDGIYDYSSYNNSCRDRLGCANCLMLGGYAEYWIVDIPLMRLYLKKNVGLQRLEECYLMQNSQHGRASFFAIPFSIFPDDIFIVRANEINKNKCVEYERYFCSVAR